MTQVDECAVGARFSLQQRRATVKFVGEIPRTEGIWLGVEWDDGQGKHSGNKYGVQYFHCRVPGAGSFIRRSARISWGVSFLRALSEKYLPSDTVPVSKAPPQATYSRKNLADIELETPNLDGVITRLATRLGKMKEVGLGGWKPEPDPENPSQESFAEIAFAFDRERGEVEGEIAATSPGIRWLDLSRSLIPTWTELSRICTELAKLETLILHFNRFAPAATQAPLPEAFDHVKELLLDGTLIDWPEIERLASSFPLLTTLQLGHNSLTSLLSCDSFDFRTLSQLKTLNLEGNRLASWSNIVHVLGQLPSLTKLYLSKNLLLSIPPPEPDDSAVFPALQHITLRSNPLSSWSDFDALEAWLSVGRPAGSLSGLQSLSIGIGEDDCLITKGVEVRDARPILIARLAHLQILDGAVIRQVDRRDAELFYITHVSRLALPADERERLHPNFKRLCAAHEITPSAPSTAVNNLRSKLIDARVYTFAGVPSMKSIAQHLHSTIEPAPIARILRTAPLRLALPKVMRALSMKDAKAVKEVWVALCASSPVDNPQEPLSQAASSFQIVFRCEDLASDLASYDMTSGDAIILVS